MKTLGAVVLVAAVVLVGCGKDGDGSGGSGGAKVSTARSAAKLLAGEGHAKWSMDNQGKSCPSTADELADAIGKSVKDPWGNEYIVRCGSDAPPGTAVGVASAGPDGKSGTADDVNSWD